MDVERLSHIQHETATVEGRCTAVGPSCKDMLIRPDTEEPFSLYAHVAGRPDGRDHVLYRALCRHRMASKQQSPGWERPDDEATEAADDPTTPTNSTAFHGESQRMRVQDWIADANTTIKAYGRDFSFTGRPDMLFSRFEKYVDMVFEDAPRGLTNNQITTLYASLLSNERPEKGRPAPRQWFLERLANPLEHDVEEDSSYVGTSRIRPIGNRPPQAKMDHIRG